MFRRFGILWLVLTLLVAAAVGFAAYQAGLATHLPAAAAGATTPYYGDAPFWAFGFFGIFHVFGLLFFLFLLFVLLRFAFFGRRWAGGHGGWHGGPPEAMRERMRERFEEMHRQAHGEEPPPAASA